VRSIPGIGPPVALLIGGRTRLPFAAFLSPATINRSPSSMRDVSVRPSAAALRLARSSRPSGSRTVVRVVICHDISLRLTICQWAHALMLDAETLIDDFFDAVERLLQERGIGMTVVRVEDRRLK
jgi:hypothetical protein